MLRCCRCVSRCFPEMKHQWLLSKSGAWGGLTLSCMAGGDSLSPACPLTSSSPQRYVTSCSNIPFWVGLDNSGRADTASGSRGMGCVVLYPFELHHVRCGELQGILKGQPPRRAADRLKHDRFPGSWIESCPANCGDEVDRLCLHSTCQLPAEQPGLLPCLMLVACSIASYRHTRIIIQACVMLTASSGGIWKAVCGSYIQNGTQIRSDEVQKDRSDLGYADKCLTL